MTTRNRSARRALGAALTVLVAAATLSLAPATAGAVGSGNEAQISSANAFLRNSYAEVGARPNGSFGSSVVQPAWWHGNFTPGFGALNSSANSGIGFRTDRDKDGWGVGRDDGDFFTPGAPYEGWSVQTTGATRFNNDSITGVVGSYGAADTAGDPSAVWDSADDSSGVLVHLVHSIPANGDQQLNVDVTLTNPAGTPVDAYYGQALDPDNCQQYATISSQAICDFFGDGLPDLGPAVSAAGFRTRNEILSQRLAGGATSAVSATQTDGSALTLWSADRSALVVTYGGGTIFGSNFCSRAPLNGIYAIGPSQPVSAATTVSCGTGSSRVATLPGNATFGDNAMSLVVKKTVPANGSVTFRVSYSFSAAAYADAVVPANLVDLTEGPLDTMTVGTPYTFDLEAIGIAVPTYTVTAGTLPAGLTLDPATGAISGTPTTAGPYDFSVTATGTEGSATKQYTGTVLAAPGVPPTWTSNTLPVPVKGRPYSSGVTATAPGNAPGTGTITYEIAGDASTLPAGLTLDAATGAVTGTPTIGGPYDFTIVATNEFGFVTQQFTGTIGVPPTWTDTTLAAPTATRPYADAIAATGTGPITYAVTAGRLPAGLTLNPTTGAVTGTPTTPGPALFVITASNAYGSVTQGFGFVVAPRPRTTVRGTVFFVGSTTRPTTDGKRVLARLAAAAPRGATNVRVTVEGWAEFKRGPLPAVVRLARNRTAFVNRDLQKRRLVAAYSGTTGGRYPVPGPTGRRAEVTVSWDTPN